jgi:hypothetical protein
MSDTPISAKKGCTFHFEIATIMIAIAMMKVMMSAIPDIRFSFSIF